MQNRPARPLFAQAITQVRKQYQSTQVNKKNHQSKTNQKIHNEDMSSGEQQRLVKMGVNIQKTKTITKQHNRSNGQQKWKNNKFHNQGKFNKSKISKQSGNWVIKFKAPQNVKQILKLVSSEKAFIEQIDQKHIKCSRQDTFKTCKSRLAKEGIKIQQKTQQENQVKTHQIKPSDQTKKSIFDRLN